MEDIYLPQGLFLPKDIILIIVTLGKNHQKATKRTRNRINEAGPTFILEKEFGPHRQNEMLLRSLKTGWFGWLPKDEIIIIKKEEVLDDFTL